ncbi:MAG: DUF5716 family protein, partial [Lachnospiraceae bacterium]|nr:DUF5716 family protein [Lachnospiraceae bacterium]
WQYESALFTCDEKEMKAYMLKSIKPDLDKQREFIIVDKVGSARLDELNAIKPFVANLNKTADESFTDFVKSIFDKKVISSVFLTGVGFEDQWYPETLKYITNGRRSFIGNNLFSKGGVYLSYSKKYVTSKVPIYLDKNKLTDEVCVYMRVNGKEGWFPIVAPGFSWYEADGKFEVIPKDIDRIEIHIENVLNGDVKTDYIDLSELKLRTDYSTRLQIDIRFIDETTLNLIVKDLGFGDFFKDSGFTTTKTISLGGYHGQFDFMS